MFQKGQESVWSAKDLLAVVWQWLGFLFTFDKNRIIKQACQFQLPFLLISAKLVIGL